MITAAQAGRALSKLGASKGGHALAAMSTPEQRRTRARTAVAARWARTNVGRLTLDQERVMRRLAGLQSVTLIISGGPAGRRRCAAIQKLAAIGKIKMLAAWGNTITIGAC